MDDFGNLTIPGASHEEYTLDASWDELMLQQISLGAYGGVGVDGYSGYDL